MSDRIIFAKGAIAVAPKKVSSKENMNCFKKSIRTKLIESLETENFYADSIPFSLSIQPLTAFPILSYGKGDFVTAFRSKAIETENKTATRILIILSPKLRKQITPLPRQDHINL